MVRTADVHHLEPDGLATAVSFLPEENLQLHPAQRGTRMPRHDAMEGEPARFQLSKQDAQLLQRASVKKVDAAAAVDEYAGEQAHMRVRAYDRVLDQSVFSMARHQLRMVLASPGDGHLRPVHELRFCRHNSAHLCFMPKVIPFILAGGSKDVILLNIRREVVVTLVRLASSRITLLVLLTSSRLCLRCSRELPSVLLQLSHELALTRGVGRFPARGVVEFARLVKHSIEGVLALFAPLTAAGSPRASLVRSRSL
jgi:hypothetical protein